MPPLAGFSNNPVRTHADFHTLTTSLLAPLTAHFSPGQARIRIPVSTGTHFDEASAQLEGYARPLWAVGALLLGHHSSTNSSSNVNSTTIPPELHDLLSPWIHGLATGTDPTHPEYWGAITPVSQRMVEAEILSFALLAAPGVFYHAHPPAVQANIATWLGGIRGKAMPATNWLWFRVLTLLALVKLGAVDVEEVRGEVDADLAMLDGFYLGEGWSADGAWARDEDRAEVFWDAKTGKGRHVDYYSGSFAIQFSQLLFATFGGGLWPERKEVYWQRAREFGWEFWRYFDAEGAAIPYGRSLAYRFACGGFFAALAIAKVPDMPEPLATPGQIKGFLLRHMRWWTSRSDDIFNSDGTMNIGWLYPNMYMSEDYNSPQSVYWSMKTLIAIALPASDEFWTSPEAPHPLLNDEPIPHSGVELLKRPHQILCNHSAGNHHFCLSSGIFVSWPMKATQAKYCKFAYSSAFGFSVPTGPHIQQIAPDNSLALSRDAGETWMVRWKRQTTKFGTAKVGDEEVPTLVSTWWPWRDMAVEVETTLIPPSSAFPDWHFRVHKIRTKSKIEAPIMTVEGGFAIKRHLTDAGVDAPECHESNIVSSTAVAIMSDAGVSGIKDFSPAIVAPNKPAASIMKPDANTNLMFPRTMIPILESTLDINSPETTLISGIFAISSSNSTKGKLDASRLSGWQQKFEQCTVHIGSGQESEAGVQISL